MAAKGNLYLLSGPEFGKRTDAINQIKNSLEKKFGEIDEHLFYLTETPFAHVMTLLQNGTLFSNGVLVLCKNAELLKKKEDLKMLTDWLPIADESSVLILVSDEISVDAKLEKIIPPACRQKFWAMSDKDKKAWLIDFFKKNEYTIENEAAQLILDLIENNTQTLRNECSRFFVCFPKGSTISADDVESILVHNREETVFTLFSEITNPSLTTQKRLEKGIEIMQKIRLSKENDSIMIISGLSFCFRKLLTWYMDGPSAIFGKTMQTQYSNAAKLWSEKQTAAILALLSETDMQIRSNSASNGTAIDDVLLQKLIYEIIVKKGAPASEYIIDA